MKPEFKGLQRGRKNSVAVFQSEDGTASVSLCRVPFSSTSKDLRPAIELYQEGQRQQAIRFLHLCQAACPWQNADHFRLRLVLATLDLEAGQADAAWHQLQRALSWRNQRENEPILLNALPAITDVEWLAMANIALHVNDFRTAEVYATKAIARTSHRPLAGVTELLHDSRADAFTVLAAARLRQRRFREATLLLRLSRDAHAKAGDLRAGCCRLDPVRRHRTAKRFRRYGRSSGRRGGTDTPERVCIRACIADSISLEKSSDNGTGRSDTGTGNGGQD